jgi:hypothetical protein
VYYLIIQSVNIYFSHFFIFLLPCLISYDTFAGVRGKESTAITITLPEALDRQLQALADRKHCGNKSAALREILYREAGVPNGSLRISESADRASIANAEKRAVKYGRGRKGKRK